MPREYDLLHKTELKIQGIHLVSGNLSLLAQRVAQELSLEPQEVVVIDVLPGIVSLDILAAHVDPQRVVGKSEQLLQAIGTIEGVRLEENATIESCGILGLLTLDPALADEVLSKSAAMAEEIAARVSRRAYILPTGFEVVKGMIEDTNSPYLASILRQEGYQVTIGKPVEDDLGSIGRRYLEASQGGYGLVISTGGVGAEGKDQSVEALLKVCAEAETPYILRFNQGEGRHVKHGVRIGVGICAGTLLICLPGPHDEVRLAGDVLLEGIRQAWDLKRLAGGLAQAIRQKWAATVISHGFNHHHEKL